MSTLEEKFEAFESQVATQHTVLTTAWTATNAKLDQLIALFGGAPPTPTATLEDVVNAIGATNTILNDIHTDTISMDQKLLRIRDAINPLGESLPLEDNSSIPWLLFRIMDAINPTWPRPTSVPAQPALSLLLALSQTQLPNLAGMYSRLGDLSTVLGSPADDSQSILRWMEDIAACACSDPNAIPELVDCTDPYASTGMYLTPFSFVGYDNVNSAIWSEPLPDGISFGTTFGIGVDDTELYSDDWSGWRIYVQSSGANFAYSPTSAVRLPTNTWQSMPADAASYSFAVRGQDSIKVILCPTHIEAPICNTYTVPWNEGSPSNVDVTGIVGRTYRATLTNADGTTCVFGYSLAEGGSTVFYMTEHTPYTFVLGPLATMSSQYGYAGAGHSPQLEICLMPEGAPS